MALILILDDRATNRNIYARLAAAIEPGIVVEVFADPVDALEWLQSNRVDLVITDYRMPGMDGAEFTRQFRTMPNGAMVPVLVVTAYDDRSFRLRALDAGATDFLQTPIDHFELVTRARNLLALGRRATPPRSGAPGLGRPRPGGSPSSDEAGRASANLEEASRPVPAWHGSDPRAPELTAEPAPRSIPPAVPPAADPARILDSLPALVSVTDRDGITRYVNAAHAAWAGRPAAELTGRPAAMLRASGQAENLAIIETGQGPPPRQETLADPDGVPRNLLTLKTPLRDVDGVAFAVLTVSFNLPALLHPGDSSKQASDG